VYGGDKYDVDEEDGGEDDGSEFDGDYDAAVSTTEEEFASCSEATVKARCLIQLYKEVTGRLVTSPICWGRNGAFKADPVFQGQRRSTSIFGSATVESFTLGVTKLAIVHRSCSSFASLSVRRIRKS